MDFNELNSELYQLSAPHRFSKQPNDFDKGYLKMSNWLNDLCYYYEKRRKQQENHDAEEFIGLVAEHKKKLLQLEDSDYKKGLLKAINKL
ncbi:MAG TPA: hypothetical protein EYO75_03555 [Sulfurimonas sp.]|nr:hypothetical protein [Sulfurimonas sp.]HIM74773.1 hypothetical protein [Campylobacterales bacterium]